MMSLFNNETFLGIMSKGITKSVGSYKSSVVQSCLYKQSCQVHLYHDLCLEFSYCCFTKHFERASYISNMHD